MARAAGAVAPETTGDGTNVIAANPALKSALKGSAGKAKAQGPIDDEGRFTGLGVKGLSFERRWTTPGIHPYDEITWELRTRRDQERVGQDRVRADGH